MEHLVHKYLTQNYRVVFDQVYRKKPDGINSIVSDDEPPVYGYHLLLELKGIFELTEQEIKMYGMNWMLSRNIMNYKATFWNRIDFICGSTYTTLAVHE